MSDLSDLDMDRLKFRQILADIDQKRADIEQKYADRDRKRQELRLAPWQLVFGGFAAGAALMAGAVAILKLLFP